jgi:cobaltochelatase CobS
MSNYNVDDELANIIRGSQASAQANTPAAPTAPTIMIAHPNADGAKLFSEVFGFKPKQYVDFPVKVFAPTDWDAQIRGRIPTPDPDYHFNPDVLERVAYGLFVGGAMLLWGATGTGKTSALKEVFALLSIPYFRISCDEQQESSAFLGTNSVVAENGVGVTKHSHSDLTLACTYGGGIVVDEAFRSPTLLTIQAVLEDKPTLALQDATGAERSLVPPKGKFWIALTDNTAGNGGSSDKYLTQPQDLSTLDRIRTTIEVPYLPVSVECQLIRAKFAELALQDIKQMVQVANLIRDAHVNGNMEATMSVRGVLAWAEDTRNCNHDLAKGLRSCYYDKLSDVDKTIVKNIYHQVTNDVIGAD